jgi:putative oxidoreductase
MTPSVTYRLRVDGALAAIGAREAGLPSGRRRRTAVIEKPIAAKPSPFANPVASWISWSPQLRSVLRIVTAFLFIQHGTMKLFAFPMGIPPDGSTVPLFSQAGLAGALETFGGLLLLLGLFTRPIAFIVSGEMAVAYFMVSAPLDFWPIVNNGVTPVLFCFIWLYFSAAGAGPWSLDALREAAPAATERPEARLPMPRRRGVSIVKEEMGD